jgi:hypothetical protein
MVYIFGHTSVSYTSLTLSENFVLPSTITIVGENFMRYAFYGITNIVFRSNFSPPTNATVVGDYYLFSAFANTGNFLLPKDFSLKNSAIGKYYVSSVFEDSKITVLPADFDIPQNISVYQNGFCYAMFRNSNLEYLPQYFDLPQHVDYNNAPNVFVQIFYNTKLKVNQETISDSNRLTIPASDHGVAYG